LPPKAAPGGPDSASTERSKPARIRIPASPQALPLRAALLARDAVMGVRLWYLRRIAKMDLAPNVKISLRAILDFTNPRGVHVGEGTYIAFHATILAHDMSRLLHTDTYIGRNCFIGAQSIIMPGVRVGDECIVASGAVVTKDVPSHSIVAGNPAQIVRSGIRTLPWGILADAYEEVTGAKAAVQPKTSSG
jgi:acetyltransferase-like isoleucine patch superfamily enzyme